MMLGFLTMNATFFKGRAFRDFIYFLMLTALAMALLNPIIVLFSIIITTVISFVSVISKFKTGYIAVALSVCKNE